MNLYYILLASLFLAPFSHAEEKSQNQIETSFAREVMMPLGLPILSSYHAIRESFFLNTKVKGRGLIESIGDFFLIPSQYLFAGKTVKIKERDYEIYPSFQYGRMRGLKTLASIVALPVGDVMGTLFKGLSYLSPEVRRKHRGIKKMLASPSIRSQISHYKAKGFPPFHCDLFIPCQGHERPSDLLPRQKIEIEALKDLGEFLDAHGIIWWIDCGTCLGAYRYGGMIPWDWDVDVSILLPDHENVKKILSHLDPKKYQIQDWSSYDHPQTFLKLYVKETKNFIDIYHYAIDEEKREVAYFFTFKDSLFFPESWKKIELKCTPPLRYEAIFPLKKAKFDQLTVWAPNDVVTFLKSKYGDNLDPAKVWDVENECYRKVEGHPYYDE